MERKEGSNRILTMYNMLINNMSICKSKMTNEFNVSEKTIRRDIDEIRTFFYDNKEKFGEVNIKYDRKKEGYVLTAGLKDNIREQEVLVLIKILLGCRGLCKEEAELLTTRLICKLDVKEKGIIKDLVGNELENYISPRHNKNLIEIVWNLEQAIRFKEKIKIKYRKVNGIEKDIVIDPKGIIYSEYYFYLIANSEKGENIVYRIDRILSYKLLGEKFYVREVERFKEGEFRKTIQFMQKDDLMRVKFEFIGESVEAILDRVPTAQIVKQEGKKFIIEAKVHKRGIKMWLLSQGRFVKVMEPRELINEIKEELQGMISLY